MASRGLTRAIRAVCGGHPAPAYAGAPTRRPLDAHLDDTEWLATAAADSAFMLLDAKKNAAAVDSAGNLAWVSGKQADAIGAEERVMLGRRAPEAVPPSFLNERYARGVSDRYCFGAIVEPAAAEAIDSVAGWVGLRDLAASCTPAEAAMAGQARNLHHWHRSHRFCGSCGGATALAKGGWKRLCGSCGREHFPRTDPVVIAAVLSADGQRCLLGKNAAWPARRFSCLAGFLDPGETLEEAVRREVREEAGVGVGDVFYHSSQPWPNGPSPQLMLGAIAVAESDRTERLAIDTNELETARWVEMSELRAALEGSSSPEWLQADRQQAHESSAEAAPAPLILPPPLAIAHRLLSACAALEVDGDAEPKIESPARREREARPRAQTYRLPHDP